MVISTRSLSSAGSSVFAQLALTCWHREKKEKKTIIHEGVSRDYAGFMRAVAVQNDPSRNLLFICWNTQTGNHHKKQTPSDLKDLLIPRQKFQSIFR